MRNEILIVQNDPAERTAMRTLLEDQGHLVAEAINEDEARKACERSLPDAIVLRWSNPQALRGLIESLPHNGRAAPCTIVTAGAAELHEAVAALDMGADDCVRSPVQAEEFVARLNASLRRRNRAKHEQVSAGPLVLDKTIHSVHVNGIPVTLAPTEFRLLTFFLEHPGPVFSRDEILRGAWQRNVTAGSRTVDVHVRRLRQALEPFGCADMIQTIRSFGYRFRQPE
jgi:two-component system phosphate regulon response regulator PhoB